MEIVSATVLNPVRNFLMLKRFDHTISTSLLIITAEASYQPSLKHPFIWLATVVRYPRLALASRAIGNSSFPGLAALAFLWLLPVLSACDNSLAADKRTAGALAAEKT